MSWGSLSFAPGLPFISQFTYLAFLGPFIAVGLTEWACCWLVSAFIRGSVCITLEGILIIQTCLKRLTFILMLARVTHGLIRVFMILRTKSSRLLIRDSSTVLLFTSLSFLTYLHRIFLEKTISTWFFRASSVNSRLILTFHLLTSTFRFVSRWAFRLISFFTKPNAWFDFTWVRDYSLDCWVQDLCCIKIALVNPKASTISFLGLFSKFTLMIVYST